jgi:uncharacterized membrane-anchored protein YitT (DUF2179 family)
MEDHLNITGKEVGLHVNKSFDNYLFLVILNIIFVIVSYKKAVIFGNEPSY